MATGPDALPPFDRAALLLDVDGTLLDIAPTPDAVVVAPGLPDALLGLRAHLSEALALISGRPVEQLDALLPGVPFAVAGEHGGAIRHAPGEQPQRPALPAMPDALRDAAARLATAHSGVLLEEKAHGFVLHYRAVPALGPALHEAVSPLVARLGDGFVVAAARKAWEVRPAGADKGRALDAIMDRPPFLGRVPVFIGDDVTDQDAIEAARRRGGAGLFVPDIFRTPGGVRAWLAESNRSGRWAAW